MRDEDVAKLLDRLVRLEIAIQSINPDPAQTIQDHRDRLAAQQRGFTRDRHLRAGQSHETSMTQFPRAPAGMLAEYLK
jgi:hypothetical protein